jgi:hypothetical protein
MEMEKPLLVTANRGGFRAYLPTEHGDGVRARHELRFYGEERFREYIAMGVPCVDTRTIPDEKIAKWALWAPLVDVDIEESESATVEMNSAGLEDEWLFQAVRRHGHPMMRGATYGNLGRCTVTDYCRLAVEWGATVHNPPE